MKEAELQKMPWFIDLVAEVEDALHDLGRQHESQVPALVNEKQQLENQINGWTQSLAKPELPGNLRSHIEEQYSVALQRITEIDYLVEARSAEVQQLGKIVDPAAVVERLNRLSEVLASNNPSLGNIELAHHIDRIECFKDGRVIVRACKLGALASAVNLFANVDPNTATPVSLRREPSQVIPRRLTRRRIDSAEEPSEELKNRAIWATDLYRFAGLDERWFEERVYHVPKRLSWAEENAPQVAARRKLDQTEEQLATHFGKTLPTIRKSLKIARKTDAELRALPRRMPRARWHEDNALTVAASKVAGMSMKEMVEKFNKSDTTIRAALNHAKHLGARSMQAADSASVSDATRS